MSVEFKGCPQDPNNCALQFDPMAGFYECECGMRGWAGLDGRLYNSPDAAEKAKPDAS